MRKILTKLSAVYYAVYVAAIVAALLGFYILKHGYYINPLSGIGVTIQSVLIILIIGSVPVALALFHRKTKKWAQIKTEEEKLQKYTRGAILRIAVIGTGLVLGVIFYYLMKSQSMLFCAGISAIALFFCKPTKVKLITELKLEENND